MTDKKNQAEWEKSKRIEAERMKAARAMQDKKGDSNLAFLDPKSTKISGYSSDVNVVMASAERIGNRSLIFAVAGVVLGLIGQAGGIVTTTYDLGMAGVMISGIPDVIGSLSLFLAGLMSIVVIISSIFYKMKLKKKFGVAFWSALCALAIVVLYCVILVIMV